MKRFNWLLGALLVVMMTACAPLASIGQNRVASTVESTSVPDAPPATTPTEPLNSEDLLMTLEGRLEKIYEQVNPSVVNIQVVIEQSTPSTFQIPDLPFRFPFQLPTPETPQQQQALGSGFVWDTEGHVVTNNHVVDGAEKIIVTFMDGTSVKGTVTGTDPDSDLAVIQVDLPADQLHPVTLANSTDVKVGQLAVAIGNPFGLEGTMTVGFVSALGRLLPVENSTGLRYSIPDVIQTDAPINPGNSGGVLVDDQGHVIGVTAAIESPVRANAGVGFVIPSAIVDKVVPALINEGSYQHPWLGISGMTLTADLNQAMQLDSDQRGVLVIDVVTDSPADKAGLHGSDREAEIDGQSVRIGGDVIVSVNGEPVHEIGDVLSYLARHTEVGQMITLSILRQGKEQTVQVELMARPVSKDQAAESDNPEVSGGAWLGINGLTLVPEIAQAMDLDADQQGVIVAQVVENSPAAEAGLRGSYKTMTLNGEQILIGGDIIVAVDGKPTTSIEALASTISEFQPTDRVTLTLVRDGRQIEIQVTLAERPANIG